jgi:hypothetical protein
MLSLGAQDKNETTLSESPCTCDTREEIFTIGIGIVSKEVPATRVSSLPTSMESLLGLPLEATAIYAGSGGEAKALIKGLSRAKNAPTGVSIVAGASLMNGNDDELDSEKLSNCPGATEILEASA